MVSRTLPLGPQCLACCFCLLVQRRTADKGLRCTLYSTWEGERGATSLIISITPRGTGYYLVSVGMVDRAPLYSLLSAQLGGKVCSLASTGWRYLTGLHHSFHSTWWEGDVQLLLWFHLEYSRYSQSVPQTFGPFIVCAYCFQTVGCFMAQAGIHRMNQKEEDLAMRDFRCSQEEEEQNAVILACLLIVALHLHSEGLIGCGIFCSGLLRCCFPILLGVCFSDENVSNYSFH